MNIVVNGDVYIHFDDEDEVDVKKNVKNVRTTKAVKSAKSTVKSRDGCCQCCGEMDKQLQVHHILSVAKYPELASDMGNMIALCQICHDRYHKMYNGDDVNAVTFAKYLKDYGTRIYGGR